VLNTGRATYAIVRPSAIRRIPATEFSGAFAERFAHPLQKAMFFAVREGLAATRRKYESKTLERKIEAALSLVLARVDLDDRCLVAITRDLGGALIVEKSLLLEGPPGLDLQTVAATENVLCLFESYLPVEECPLGATLADAVTAANPRLGRARAETIALARDRGSLVKPSAASPGEKARGFECVRKVTASQHKAVFFVGFGGYVREVVLPYFTPYAAAACDYRARLIGRDREQPFPLFTSIDPLLELVAQCDRPLVIIASYHSAHARQAAMVLEANPEARVFIEKPAAVTDADAELIAQLQRHHRWIDIGYNRRYAPMVLRAKAFLAQEPGPFTMVASARENAIPPSHWYLWPNQGTRVTGNLTHWIDLSLLLAGCDISDVAASGSPNRAGVVVSFANGSVATLAASVDGDALRGVQEQIEIRTPSRTLRIHDFTRLEVVSGGSRRSRMDRKRQKGHDQMYRSLRDRWLGDGPPLYPAEDVLRVQEVLGKALAALTGSTAARPDHSRMKPHVAPSQTGDAP
jgi:predicted dehydrogenase